MFVPLYAPLYYICFIHFASQSSYRTGLLLRCSKSAAYSGLSGLLTDVSRTVDIDPERASADEVKRSTFVRFFVA